MKKLIPMFLAMFVSTISTAQTEIITQKNAISTNTFSLMSSQSSLNYSNPISEMEIEKDNPMPQVLCLNLSSNFKQQRPRSSQFGRFDGRGSENPYKARNIGIGFLIGGILNAGIGGVIMYNSQEAYQNASSATSLGSGFGNYNGIGIIIGAGAVVIGGASIIGGTIATIIGSVHGHKYANSKLKIKSNGNSFGIAYNF